MIFLTAHPPTYNDWKSTINAINKSQGILPPKCMYCIYIVHIYCVCFQYCTYCACCIFVHIYRMWYRATSGFCLLLLFLVAKPRSSLGGLPYSNIKWYHWSWTINSITIIVWYVHYNLYFQHHSGMGGLTYYHIKWYHWPIVLIRVRSIESWTKRYTLQINTDSNIAG